MDRHIVISVDGHAFSPGLGNTERDHLKELYEYLDEADNRRFSDPREDEESNHERGCGKHGRGGGERKTAGRNVVPGLVVRHSGSPLPIGKGPAALKRDLPPSEAAGMVSRMLLPG